MEDVSPGTGTTMLAAIKTGRSSIGVEIDRGEFTTKTPRHQEESVDLRNLWLSSEQMALRRLERETRSIFSGIEVTFTPAAEMEPYPAQRIEHIAAVSDATRRKRTRRN